MNRFETLKKGSIGLIREKEDGTIQQIGLSDNGSKMLQVFLAALSKDEKLVALPNEFDLTIKTK